MEGGEGDDTLHGRAGDDTLIGDAGLDRLFGKEGNDLIDGGDGADRLEGGDGRDMLIGGNGQDTALGGAHDDILIAGSLVERIGPNTIHLEWNSSHDYAQRVKNLRGGSGRSSDRRNTYFLRGVSHSNPTVVDDGVAGDILRGNDGEDYFIAHKRGDELDRVYRELGELLNQI